MFYIRRTKQKKTTSDVKKNEFVSNLSVRRVVLNSVQFWTSDKITMYEIKVYCGWCETDDEKKLNRAISQNHNQKKRKNMKELAKKLLMIVILVTLRFCLQVKVNVKQKILIVTKKMQSLKQI